MCDLLALSFNHPVNTKLSLDLFQIRGKENPDGWGVAYYREERLHVVKEPTPSVESPLFDFVEGYPRTRTLISHVRRSTRGGKRYANTHPFNRELRIGNQVDEYAFAHNGTLQDLSSLSLDYYGPIGETDSEQVFCYILDTILKHRISNWSNDDFVRIERLLRSINTPGNTLNCIFSNGTLLFCYSDENDHNSGLRFLRFSSTSGKFDLRDEENRYGQVKIEPTVFNDYNQSETQGVLVSTRRLGSYDWNEFREGELIVFRRGNTIYPPTRKK
ncbi:MAG: class II glutamine amidotransferase [Candidatus Thorarchaeota archaeon]